MDLTKISRSAIDTRLQCEMKRWYQYHFKGTGLSKRSPFSATAVGTNVHGILSKVIAGGELKTAVFDATEDLRQSMEGHTPPSPFYVKEQRALMGGLAWAWTNFRLPHILDEYTIESTEQEFSVEIWPGFEQTFRMDVILRRKDSGKLAILDFKTATSVNESWVQQWDHDIQTILYLEGLKKFAQEDVDGIIYEGLIKGQRRKDTAQASSFFDYEIQSSPFCYGYRHKEGMQPVQTEWPGSYKSWEKVSASMVVGDDWERWPAEVMEPDVMYDQLATTELVSPPPETRMKYVDNIFLGEKRFNERLDIIHRHARDAEELIKLENLHLERNPKQCLKYGTRYMCEFYDLCYSSEVREDPFGSGLYAERVDHHQEKKEEE